MTEIQHLVILSGPSCSGKSTLINKIKTGKVTSLCQQLKIKEPVSWVDMYAKELLKMPLLLPSHLIIHYDLCEHSLHPQDFDFLPTLIAKSKKIDIVTLYVPLKTLQRRMRVRIIRRYCLLFLKIGQHRKALRYISNNRYKSQIYYQNSTELLNLYNNWFTYCQKLSPINHWIFEFDQEKFDIYWKN